MLEAKHKISFFEKVMGILGKGNSRYTTDWTPEKKFSDLTEWIRKRYKPGVIGKVLEDGETNGVYEFKYDHKAWRVHFIVQHIGDYATNLKVEYYGPGAPYTAKCLIHKAEKELETVKRPENFEKMVKEESTPAVDYKAMDMKTLVSEMDAAVKAFGKTPSAATFAPVPKIKEAIEEKIDDMPAAKRAPFNKAIADMGMYVQAISSQLAMPMVNVAMFAGTYVSQMKAAVSSMAAALE